MISSSNRFDRACSDFLLGLENLESASRLFEGRRVGLLTTAAATDSRLVSAVDVLAAFCDLRALFGPEHGIRGDLQAGDAAESTIDRRTGLPVHSLYTADSSARGPKLDGLDMLVVDLVDAGSRYYTYLSTLSYAMESCAAASVPIVVLDRPNPLGGLAVEGPTLHPGYASFVGLHRVPVRHGLTVAEYARLINERAGIGCELHVVPIVGWARESWFDELPLCWVMPSPNLPTLESALLYAGTCLFEGTNVSEGRGTTRPFELVGAPWLDPCELMREMPSDLLEGAMLRECWFRPVVSKHAGQACAGVQIHVTDRSRLRPYSVGVALLDAIRRTHPQFSFTEPASPDRHPFIDLLAGDSSLRDPAFDLGAYLRRCEADSAQFCLARNDYLIYDSPGTGR